jgi:hypothetical protein
VPGFQIASNLSADAGTLNRELFNMEGVNRELSPWIRMSAPPEWRDKPITEWPCRVSLFTSVIYLFGWIPIDRHHFRLDRVSDTGFSERSRSVLNREWNHRRAVSACGTGCTVRDSVDYRSHLGPLGYLFLPIYRLVFMARHRKLKSSYGSMAR